MFAFGTKQTFVNSRSQPLLTIMEDTLSIHPMVCVFSQKILFRVIILYWHCSNMSNSVEAVLKLAMEWNEEIK